MIMNAMKSPKMQEEVVPQNLANKSVFQFLLKQLKFNFDGKVNPVTTGALPLPRYHARVLTQPQNIWMLTPVANSSGYQRCSFLKTAGFDLLWRRLGTHIPLESYH